MTSTTAQSLCSWLLGLPSVEALVQRTKARRRRFLVKVAGERRRRYLQQHDVATLCNIALYKYGEESSTYGLAQLAWIVRSTWTTRRVLSLEHMTNW